VEAERKGDTKTKEQKNNFSLQKKRKTCRSKTLSVSSAQTKLASLNLRDDSSDDVNDDISKCKNKARNFLQGYLHFVS